MRGFRAQSSSRSSWLSSVGCWRPHAQSDTMTGSRLTPSLVAVYSTRGGTSLKISRWTIPLLHLAQRLDQHLLTVVGHQSLQL
jgi:hypothetical protein